MLRRGGDEQVFVALREEQIVEDGVETGRAHRGRAWPGVGVRLVTHAGEGGARESMPRLPLVDFGEEGRGALSYFLRHVRALDGLVKIGARGAVRAEPEIEDAKLEANTGQVGIEDQHALQGGDGGLVVAEAHRQSGELEHEVQVARILEHFLECGVVFGAEPAFQMPTILVDYTEADSPVRTDKPYVLPVDKKPGRYVRMTATRLWKRTGDYVFALAELEVWCGDKNRQW